MSIWILKTSTHYTLTHITYMTHYIPHDTHYTHDAIHTTHMAHTIHHMTLHTWHTLHTTWHYTQHTLHTTWYYTPHDTQHCIPHDTHYTMGRIRSKLESWKVRNHAENASQRHFYCFLKGIWILKSGCSPKSPIHATHDTQHDTHTTHHMTHDTHDTRYSPHDGEIHQTHEMLGRPPQRIVLLHAKQRMQRVHFERIGGRKGKVVFNAVEQMLSHVTKNKKQQTLKHTTISSSRDQNMVRFKIMRSAYARGRNPIWLTYRVPQVPAGPVQD